MPRRVPLHLRPSACCSSPCSCAATASAQQRPLVTEDPETVGAGRLLLEIGLDYEQGSRVSRVWPDRQPVARPDSWGSASGSARSPSSRSTAASTAAHDHRADRGAAVGAADVRRRLARQRSKTSCWPRRSASWVSREGAPSIGVRFATRLPNASNESGLGLDTTDFTAGLLVGKTVQSHPRGRQRWARHPREPAARRRDQNDVLIYGLSVARALTDHAEVVGEVNAAPAHGLDEIRHPAPKSRGQFRFGARYTVGAGRVDGAVLARPDVARPERRLHRRATRTSSTRSGCRKGSTCASPKPTPTATTSSSSVRRRRRRRSGAQLARALCDRHTGMGGDGVIYYDEQPDGTAHAADQRRRQPAELSGNGVRCLAALVARQRGPRAAS